MHAWMTRRTAGRAVLTVLLLGVGALMGAAPAAATPWGTSGADYTGVLCRLGAASVPLGSWTVNGSVQAYSTVDIAGQDPLFQPAPTTGAPIAMVPGQAGFQQPDIAAVAYLLARHGNGSAPERAEISATVAALAGGGGNQTRCLGQGGTSAARAAARLDEARRFAGPYSVAVAAPSGGIPGDQAAVTVVVRSASGAGTPGVTVQVSAGADVTSAVTGADGVARARVVVPSTAASTVTATVDQPTGLTYIDSSPPSIAAGASSVARGTAVLRPVLHPDPAVSVSGAELLLAGGQLSPVAVVTNTSGYSGDGTVTVTGPVTPAAGKPCSTVAAADLGADKVVWRGSFVFRGDGPQKAGTTPELMAGCYAVRASVTTTDSSPPETATSAFDPARTVTVSSLELSSAATAKVAPAGTLRAVVVADNPGRAKVSTTVVARGPVAITARGCDGAGFDSAGAAATSGAVDATRSGTGLRAVVRVPGVTRTGCYALDARNTVTLDGKTLVTSTPLGAEGTTTAVVRPQITLSASAPSGEQGTAMRGTVQVSGSFGFPGVVSVGLVQGSTVPITGCGDARFRGGAPTGVTTQLTTEGDAEYAFRTPVAARNACYALTARFVLTDNKAVTAGSGSPSVSTVFLAGLRPRQVDRTIVDAPTDHSATRALVAYGIFALLILGGCGVLFARTLGDARDEFGSEPLWSWRPNRFRATVGLRPLPGGRPSPSGRPNAG